jgi:hypothetical protein
MRAFPRLVLLGIVVGGLTNALRADGPAAPPAPATPAIPVVNVVNPDPAAAVVGAEPGWPVYPGSPAAGQGCAGCGGGDPLQNGPPNGFHCWIRRPIGCWSTHNCPCCGSLKADCTFLFGSCRQFFGEPCLKGPPPLPPYPY